LLPGPLFPPPPCESVAAPEDASVVPVGATEECALSLQPIATTATAQSRTDPNEWITGFFIAAPIFHVRFTPDRM
jgi:hypothetical protein